MRLAWHSPWESSKCLWRVYSHVEYAYRSQARGHKGGKRVEGNCLGVQGAGGSVVQGHELDEQTLLKRLHWGKWHFDYFCLIWHPEKDRWHPWRLNHYMYLWTSNTNQKQVWKTEWGRSGHNSRHWMSIGLTWPVNWLERLGLVWHRCWFSLGSISWLHRLYSSVKRPSSIAEQITRYTINYSWKRDLQSKRSFLLAIKTEASWMERQRVCFCHHSYRCWSKRRPSTNNCFVLEANYNCEIDICTMLCRTYRTSWHEYQEVENSVQSTMTQCRRELGRNPLIEEYWSLFPLSFC